MTKFQEIVAILKKGGFEIVRDLDEGGTMIMRHDDQKDVLVNHTGQAWSLDQKTPKK